MQSAYDLGVLSRYEVHCTLVEVLAVHLGHLLGGVLLEVLDAEDMLVVARSSVRHRNQ